jgi:phosphohistidine phosphatase
MGAMSEGPARHRLVLLRHAKSDWPHGVPDQDRPLGERGRREAPAAGRWLAAAGLVPDRVLVSSARRTQETWALVGPELGGDRLDVRVEDRVYEAGAGDLLDLVRETDESVGTLLVVGHNPGLEVLAMVLDDQRGMPADRQRLVTKFPTGAVAVLHLMVDRWAEVNPQTCRLVAAAVPR